jgi:hypothetical protein
MIVFTPVAKVSPANRAAGRLSNIFDVHVTSFYPNRTTNEHGNILDVNV